MRGHPFHSRPTPNIQGFQGNKQASSPRESPEKPICFLHLEAQNFRLERRKEPRVVVLLQPLKVALKALQKDHRAITLLVAVT